MSTCSSAHKARLGPKTGCTFFVEAAAKFMYRNVYIFVFACFCHFDLYPADPCKNDKKKDRKSNLLNDSTLHAVSILVCFYMLIYTVRMHDFNRIIESNHHHSPHQNCDPLKAFL